MRLRLVFTLLVLASTVPARPQDTLSLSVSNSLSSFTLTSDPTPTQSLTVRTDWNISFSWGVAVCAYMSTPMSGTGTNADTIPQASVQLNGSSIVSSTTSCGIAGARQLWSTLFVFGTGTRSTTQTIGLAGYPATLSPDTYTGTVTFVAVAY